MRAAVSPSTHGTSTANNVGLAILYNRLPITGRASKCDRGLCWGCSAQRRRGPKTSWRLAKARRQAVGGSSYEEDVVKDVTEPVEPVDEEAELADKLLELVDEEPELIELVEVVNKTVTEEDKEPVEVVRPFEMAEEVGELAK